MNLFILSIVEIKLIQKAGNPQQPNFNSLMDKCRKCPIYPEPLQCCGIWLMVAPCCSSIVRYNRKNLSCTPKMYLGQYVKAEKAQSIHYSSVDTLFLPIYFM